MILFFFNLLEAAPLVRRAVARALPSTFLPSRFTARFTLPLVRAFCVALTFAAIVPNVEPMDSATLVKSASSLVWCSCAVIADSPSFERSNICLPYVDQSKKQKHPYPINHAEYPARHTGKRVRIER